MQITTYTLFKSDNKFNKKRKQACGTFSAYNKIVKENELKKSTHFMTVCNSELKYSKLTKNFKNFAATCMLLQTECGRLSYRIK